MLPEPFHIFIPPFDLQQRLDLSIRKSIANMSRGHACDDFIRSHIFQYDSARSDNSAVADRHSRYDCCPPANPDVVSDLAVVPPGRFFERMILLRPGMEGKIHKMINIHIKCRIGSHPYGGRMSPWPNCNVISNTTISSDIRIFNYATPRHVSP